jgi:hypothetical protein
MKRVPSVLIVTGVMAGAALFAWHEGWPARARSTAKDDAIAQAGGGTTAPMPPPAGPSSAGPVGALPPEGASLFNVLSVDAGARVESATSEYDPVETPATRLIDARQDGQWCSSKPPNYPQDVVFSFLGHQQVLIASVVINLKTNEPAERSAKDVEVWSATASQATAFTKVGSATLSEDESDQTVTTVPFEARYLKIRILSSHGSTDYVELGKVKAIEGRRAGYVPLVARNPELAASPATTIVDADSGFANVSLSENACAASRRTTSPATHGSSHRVLVLTRDKKTYAPLLYSPEENTPADRSIYAQLTLTAVQPELAWPTLLRPEDGIDTVVLAQVCDVSTTVPGPFKRALMSWVADGHKLIIQDADTCGPNKVPDYGFLPFRFATSNAGGHASGSKTLFFVEENALANADPQHPGFLDVKAWLASSAGNRNELGDSNLIKSYDSHWCGQLVARNDDDTIGFVEAYAHYGRGLIIYDGFDADQSDGTGYRHLVARELAQSFDPDGLPCTARLGNFVITTESSLQTQWMSAGRTYSYPLTILSNQGYKGTVKLALAASPPDSAVSGAFDADRVDVTDLSRIVLTVTTSANAPVSTHRVAVHGTDATGMSNTLCLELAERKTGGIHVVAAAAPQAAQPRKPTRNLEIILDLSGSMKLPLGKSTRIDTARDVLRKVLAQVPDDFNVGLRFYGHRYGSRQRETCTDTELVLPIQPLDRARLLSLVDRAQPRGETPLVYSVLQTPADLKPLGGGSVVLVTDGEESCNGDPAAAVRQLQQLGIDITLNIVGFTLTGQEVERQLSAFAESTGGHYYGAQNGDALTRALLMAAVEKFPYTVFDAAGRQVAAGEAGQNASEVPAGDYRVVVRAGDEQLAADHVTVTQGSETFVRIVLKGDRFAIER